MKIISYCFCTVLFSTAAFAESRFYTEAGASYVMLMGAHYPSGAPSLASVAVYPPILEWTRSHDNKDTPKWAPFVAVGYSFTDWLGVRLSYQYIANLTARTEWRSRFAPGYETLVGVLAPIFTTTYEEDIHVLSLAPEFRWPVTSAVAVTFSPELNWVASRGEVQESYVTYYTPTVTRRVRNEKEYTLGVSAGAVWSLTKRCDLVFRYKYADLKPSFGREAHILSGAIRLGF